MSFANKVVLISGAASGIGEAAAIAFSKLSTKLSLFDKNKEALVSVSELCGRNNDKNVLNSVTDVTNDKELRKVVEDTLSEFGRIDVVVNCAGAYQSGSILDTNFMESYDKMMNLNLRSIVLLTNLVTPSLIKTKGNIINITSIASQLITPTWLPYDTSKTALTRFTKCVALELARKGVRVNAIQPGGVNTNIGINSGMFKKELNDKIWSDFGRNTPLGQLIQPQEVADLILYLASDKAKCITGVEYAIDCGVLLNGGSIHNFV